MLNLGDKVKTKGGKLLIICSELWPDNTYTCYDPKLEIVWEKFNSKEFQSRVFGAKLDLTDGIKTIHLLFLKIPPNCHYI